MTKHRFDVCGVSCTGGNLFTGVCVADDIIKAIELFRKNHYSVHNIEMKEQVHADEEIGIKNINILHIYPVEHGCKGNIYGLYKRIINHDIKAIDEITNLDESKDIIKMITGTVYFDGKFYSVTDHIAYL